MVDVSLLGSAEVFTGLTVLGEATGRVVGLAYIEDVAPIFEEVDEVEGLSKEVSVLGWRFGRLLGGVVDDTHEPDDTNKYN